MASKLTLEVGGRANSLDLRSELSEETTVLAHACNIGATSSCTNSCDSWGKLLYISVTAEAFEEPPWIQHTYSTGWEIGNGDGLCGD